MDTATPVLTGSKGATCDECGKPLPPHDHRAKVHRFCPGSKCRSAWHGKERKRALDAAFVLVEEASMKLRGRANPDLSIDRALAAAMVKLRTAGAKDPS